MAKLRLKPLTSSKSPIMSTTQIGRDREDPRGELLLGVKIMQLSGNAQEGFLGNIPCPIRIMKAFVGKGDNRTIEAADQTLQGCPISSLRGTYQLALDGDIPGHSV